MTDTIRYHGIDDLMLAVRKFAKGQVECCDTPLSLVMGYFDRASGTRHIVHLDKNDIIPAEYRLRMETVAGRREMADELNSSIAARLG